MLDPLSFVVGGFVGVGMGYVMGVTVPVTDVENSTSDNAFHDNQTNER